MTCFWTWDWFPANLCVGILTVILVLCAIRLIVLIIKDIIDDVFG
jgi:hypothetical protein